MDRLALGPPVVFSLTPDALVQVTPGAGGMVPTLTLNDGATAAYTGLDAGGNLLFSYTVGAGQNTADLTVTGLLLNGATISESSGLSGLSFQPQQIYQVGISPTSVAMADVNG